MKKMLAVCLMMVLVAGLGMNAFATTEGFTSSPSGNPAPSIVEYEIGGEPCDSQLIVTAYGDKHELPEALQKLLEKAYDKIANAGDLSELNADFAKLIKDKKLSVETLAVSDLFDIHATDCDFHDGHMDFDITLDADTLSHFVALLHMKKDGQFELVKDAEVVNNGEHLQFSVETLSPFAIVVDTSGKTPAGEQPGMDGMIFVYIAIVVVLAAIVILVLAKRKKKAA